MEILVLGDGNFGLFTNLEQLVRFRELEVTEFNLQFNIDGLPLYKSSNLQFWPILCNVKNINNTVFPVAIYSGIAKPPLQEFFSKLVTELSQLAQEGLLINNKQYAVNIHSFCCDTPARNFIKNIKGHNSFYGCDKCCVRGEHIKLMTFTNLKAPLISNLEIKKIGNIIRVLLH